MLSLVEIYAEYNRFLESFFGLYDIAFPEQNSKLKVKHLMKPE